MSQIIQLFIWIPLIAFLISLFIPKRSETVLSGIAVVSAVLNLIGILAFIGYWLVNNHPDLNAKHIVLFETEDIEIFIDFFFDEVSAVFSVMGSLLVFIVARFSKTYMHRDPGFKFFFCGILLFFLGFNLIILAGNFETLFIGWEIIGICSFLLIAFYQDRYLPVKNALKVISVYRLGDICLLLAMWMSHHLWHQNITFIQLNDSQAVEGHLLEHNWYGVFIAVMIVIAASIKSAQFPFSSWLPRAMEGPTTSSAIFYGALSVHIGAFLLLRTFPYWESILFIKILIIAIGVFTCFVATGIARVQSTVKTQIAYSSIAQIGLIFIEIALGLHWLALIHFAGNAFLRTYQLLVSPSVLGYLIHDMFFNFVPKKNSDKNTVMTRISNSLYVLSIKEWNLDSFLFRFLWNPFKQAGNKLEFLGSKPAIFILGVVFISGLACYIFQSQIPQGILDVLPFVFSFLGLLLILKSFAERGNATFAWNGIFAGQLFIALSVALLNEKFESDDVLLYLSGSLISVVVGYICLHRLNLLDSISLDQFHGHLYEHPKTGFVFLVSCLAFVGFPFTPTFIGIDLLFSHIDKYQELLIIFTTLSFIFIELSVFRMYARIFLGPHKKAYHPVAFRSS